MDTFYATKKAKCVQGFTIMQIFVSDKGLVKLHGLKSESKIKLAVKLFCKELWAPNAFICNPH